MIEEAYCSYEVSKLLKEKGFNFSHIECNKWYVTESYSTGVPWNSISYEIGDITREYVGGKVIPLITHQMAMAYLREKHNIFISIDYDSPNYYIADMFDMVKVDEFGCPYHYPPSIINCKSYEIAVEAALKYCLTNLI